MNQDLGAPLLSRKRRSEQRRRDLLARWPIARIGFGLVLLGAIAVGARLVLVNDPTGGRPVVQVPINTETPANSLAASVTGRATITADPEQFPASQVAARTDPAAGFADPVRVEPDGFGVIADLAEETSNGPIPRIAANGQTPFEAYRRASISPSAAGGKPLIAIVVTGLGLNDASTLDAIAQLPDNVTLAFAPYGKTLDKTTAAARAEGHELLLELPLEPFDYPDNDPGPQTLLTGQPLRANLDKLSWLMSRVGGYAGVTNHMGARFTSSSADFAPIMEELGTRGLGYLDDGSSNRSLAPQLAPTNRVPFSRADMVIDAVPARAAILEALQALEVEAAEQGHAIGMASALPVSIQTLAEWSAGLEERGILLVPASGLMSTEP